MENNDKKKVCACSVPLQPSPSLCFHIPVSHYFPAHGVCGGGPGTLFLSCFILTLNGWLTSLYSASHMHLKHPSLLLIEMPSITPHTNMSSPLQHTRLFAPSLGLLTILQILSTVFLLKCKFDHYSPLLRILEGMLMVVGQGL